MSERIALQHHHQDEIWSYKSAYHCNDQATGMIKTHIKASQYEGLDSKLAKQVWDTLIMRHRGIHTGLSVFYMKVGILKKKYTNGENMHEHLNFLTMENRKLGTKDFDDNFLAQVMLMLLPCKSTWETLIAVLLQSTSDNKPLTTTDVTMQLMQEHCHLNSNDTDSALAACSTKKAGSSKRSKCQCGYCKKLGHTENECWKKKRDQENDDGKNLKEKKKKKGGSTVREITRCANQHLNHYTKRVQCQAQLDILVGSVYTVGTFPDINKCQCCKHGTQV